MDLKTRRKSSSGKKKIRTAHRLSPRIVLHRRVRTLGAKRLVSNDASASASGGDRTRRAVSRTMPQNRPTSLPPSSEYPTLSQSLLRCFENPPASDLSSQRTGTVSTASATQPVNSKRGNVVHVAPSTSETVPTVVSPQRSPSSDNARRLVDHAITVLGDIWKSESIPPIFASMTTVSLPKVAVGESTETHIPRIVHVGGLMPLGTFVQGILAQSHTTGGVLQIALNYIEVLRPKLALLMQSPVPKDMEIQPNILDQQVLMKLLPSPLLCPRRVFLAAIILAWKFLEDVCILNRQWAKITGLPAWEVGRCERAVGEALDWRLWVLTSADVAKRLENTQ